MSETEQHPLFVNLSKVVYKIVLRYQENTGLCAWCNTPLVPQGCPKCDNLPVPPSRED